MTFHNTLNYRRSIRHFSDKTIEDTILMEIVKEAQRSPSWVNSQPWRVYIAKGETANRIKIGHKKLSDSGIKGQSDIPIMSRHQWSKATQTNMQTFLKK